MPSGYADAPPLFRMWIDSLFQDNMVSLAWIDKNVVIRHEKEFKSTLPKNYLPKIKTQKIFS